MINYKFLNITFSDSSSYGSILNWMLDTSISIALLIGVILIIRKPIARYFGSTAAYLLWLLLPLRLALPTIAILPRPEETAEIFYSTVAIINSSVQAIPNDQFSTSIYLIPALITLWILCASLWLCSQLATQALYQKKLLRNADTASQELIREANIIAEQYAAKKSFNIYQAHDEIGPLVTGVLNPIIILPKSFHSQYNVDERRLALTHEIMHIQRGDLWVVFSAMVFRALQWPNPMVHIAWRAFRSDQESACDAAVLNSAHPIPKHKLAYASALVKAAKNYPETQTLKQATILPLAQEVKERLMLMKNTPNQKRRLAGSVAVSAIIAIGLGSTAQYGYAQQDADPVIIKEQADNNVFINEDGDGKTITIKKVTSSTKGEDVNINIKTLDGIEEISLRGDSLMMFHAKTDQDCAKLEAALSKSIPDTGTKDKTKSKDKKITKSVMVFSGTDEEGIDTTSQIKIGTHTIVCSNGKLIEETLKNPEMEVKYLRKAIEHLKKEEEQAAERIRETRKRLEERLVELEKEAAGQ